DFVGEVELAEGTVEKEKTRLLDRDDMLTNAIGTFDSVTVGCARCHDHKFDPIPQRDYYRLQAVFAGVDRGDRPIPDPALDARRSSLDTERAAATARRSDLLQEAAALSSPALTRCDQALAEAKQRLAAVPLPVGKA